MSNKPPKKTKSDREKVELDRLDHLKKENERLIKEQKLLKAGEKILEIKRNKIVGTKNESDKD